MLKLSDSRFGYPLPSRGWIVESKLVADMRAQNEALELLALMQTGAEADFFDGREEAYRINRDRPYRDLCGAILVYVYVNWDSVSNIAGSLELLVSDFGSVGQIYQPLASDVVGMGFLGPSTKFNELLRQHCSAAISELISDGVISASNTVL